MLHPDVTKPMAPPTLKISSPGLKPCRWVHKAPHLPPAALEEALFNAAFHDGAHGLHASTGMVIATAGERTSKPQMLIKN